MGNRLYKKFMLEIIDSRVRDQCVESDILALGTPAALLLQQGYKEIVPTQSTQRMPHLTTSNLYLRSSNAGNLLCMQLLNKELGVTVERKYVCGGQFEIQVETECPMFKGLDTRQLVLLTNGGFTLEKREQQCNDYIRRTVGHDKIVLSSGFDSAVCASLLHKALLRGDESSRKQVLIRVMVHYANIAAKEHDLLNRIEIGTSEEERLLLEVLSSHNQYVATLLPIRTVGVQGDCRTCSYCVVLSSDQTQPNWSDLATCAHLISRECHEVNRVYYLFGKAVRELVTDITPTYLTGNILATLREADYLVNKILRDSGCYKKLAQMPIALIPFHFDRDLS
ncbi:GMP synthase [Daphnia magna]|uniref:GMP synthase n=1 Tax=Daphnia magna TaxID=35525 RepID=A0A164YR76_9CRUS|nr:GMP synthase [Daphnia magna]